MNTAYGSSTNRRTYIRVTYAPDRRPTLMLEDVRFDIIDISESGIRLHNPRHAVLPGSFQARVQLLGGRGLDVRVEMQWQENGEVGLSLAELLPAAIIEKEQRQLILVDG